MPNYDELLNQLATELQASLASKATAEQIGDATSVLIGVGEPIDAAMLKSVGIVVFDNSQAFVKADPNLLNAIVQQARTAQTNELLTQTRIRRALRAN
jgi:hypothetical protein